MSILFNLVLDLKNGLLVVAVSAVKTPNIVGFPAGGQVLKHITLQ